MEELDRRLQQWLWPDEPGTSHAATAGRTAGQLAYALVRDFIGGDLTLRAMSLVYTTMLASVPLLAFSFSVLKGLGFHRELEPLLLNFLEPLESRAGEISDSILSFVDNLSSSGLATVSLVLLLFTALSVAQKVETSLNFVWRVDRPRSFARRFSEYLSVLLIGPVIMSITMGLIATVSSTTLMNRMRSVRPFGDWMVGLSALTPYVLVICAFTLLYLFVPNTRVRTRPAAIGGFSAGLLWVGGGNLFTKLVVDASRTDAIYSGFAIVIMTMLWLYFSWLILLFGAQIAFYLQNPEYLRHGQRKLTMSNGLRERLAFGIMLIVGRDFDESEHRWRAESLASRMRVPRHLLQPVIGALMHERLLVETKDQQLMPGKDLHHITLLDIATAVRGHGLNRIRHDSEWITVQRLAERLELSLRCELDGETLADMIAQDAEAKAEAETEAERGSESGARFTAPRW